jgi:cytochrome c553
VRIRSLVFVLLIFASVAVLFPEELAIAQGPGPGSTATPRATVQVQANLAQLMRGILLPNSNVVFFAQSNNPADVKPAADPSSATDPLASTYGGWTAVENSSLALSEAARLLTVPGRVCSNGRPVPVMNADWGKFVQGLRQAGIAAFKAAQTKNQDKMLDAADVVTTACTNCHNVYREKTEQQGGLASRCTK